MSGLDSRHFERFVEGSPLHSWISDERGRMVYVNAAARGAIELLTQRPFLPGAPIVELYPPAMAELYVASDRRVLETNAVVETLEPAVRPDGTSAKLLVRKFPLGEGLIGGIAIDISDQIDAQAAVEARLREAEKIESIGVLAGGIAHDFNNLLAGILGNLDLVRRGLPEAADAAHNALRIAKEAATRAAALTKQLLAYAGKQRLAPANVDLVEIVRSTVELVGKRRTHVDLVAPAPAFVHADEVQLGQVVMNLVLNALEALESKDGRVQVAIREQAIDRAFLARCVLGADAAPGSYVVLEVRDEGPGMDASTAARIFEPFFTTKPTGRGLGLAATLGILRSHGGALRLDTDVGQGTTFTLLLPPAEAPSVAPPAPAPAAPTRKATVLLVDDDAAVRHAAARLLDISDLQVLEAAGGIEALAIFRERHAEIDVVVLDLRMPDMDGEETNAELRKIDPDVRVIVCSGLLDPDVVTRLVANGVFALVAKPFEVNAFLEMIESAAKKA